MFDEDPFAPPAKKPVSLDAQLEIASIEELQDRIERLKAEIQLCEKAINAKRAAGLDVSAAIDAVLAERKGPRGDTYALERDKDGPHGRIMKYNLNKG